MAESDLIETPRLLITPFKEEHLTQRYVNWLNDPDVVKYSEQLYKYHTLESCRTYWESYKNTPHYFWAIISRDAIQGHIGNLNAYVDTNNRVADMGILIGDKRIWGNGYGTEAWIAVGDYLLNHLGLRKISAGTLEVNLGMINIMRHSGMTEDGRRRRHYLFEGQEVDLIFAAVFIESWEHL